MMDSEHTQAIKELEARRDALRQVDRELQEIIKKTPLHLRGRQGKKRGKSSNVTQLSSLGRKILLLLLIAETDMELDPKRATELKNRGIPWNAGALANSLGVKVQSISRTLTSLDNRKLVFCWAAGEGRGRRVRYVRLTDNARAIAALQGSHGISHDQGRRMLQADRRKNRQLFQTAHLEKNT